MVVKNLIIYGFFYVLKKSQDVERTDSTDIVNSRETDVTFDGYPESAGESHQGFSSIWYKKRGRNVREGNKYD